VSSLGAAINLVRQSTGSNRSRAWRWAATVVVAGAAFGFGAYAYTDHPITPAPARTATVSGTVFIGGRPQSQGVASLAAQRATVAVTGETSAGRRFSGLTETDARGHFRLRVPTGSYHLVARTDRPGAPVIRKAIHVSSSGISSVTFVVPALG
jgi:hypothetical protein